MTTIYFGQGERWHVIEFPEVLLKRWRRAMPRTYRLWRLEVKRPARFFPVRYAGSLRYVNPTAVAVMSGGSR